MGNGTGRDDSGCKGPELSSANSKSQCGCRGGKKQRVGRSWGTGLHVLGQRRLSVPQFPCLYMEAPCNLSCYLQGLMR